MDKLDLILEKLEKIDILESKIDKIQSDITALKSNNKLINSKLDSLTEITYTIMENETEHKMRIEKLENKAV
ncbi:hypothetical protein LY28_03134 [Ruminiclostridium sufflavum DSM 19573]|uniref:Uncharacterized protein n=1 Tax=Ruminiclostridium sufflavum DSM 19573 TaxID=1121337 RepID=A0A318XK87_9FIRM|nr:hypothetical protein [Ruminiclostridium sufflavum]PYG85837.1 hypothetical protein LY28_03134 [Ruminiclostridium sufflavum DSM 19573]